MLVAGALEVISTSAITVGVLAVLGYAARTWLKSEIQEAVKHGYEADLERLKEELRWDALRRERAAAIADLLASWIAPNFDASKDPDVALLETQRKYWELVLWLDADALRALNDGLAHKAHHVDALLRVRRSIVGEEPDPVTAAELISWWPQGSGADRADDGSPAPEGSRSAD